MFSFFENIPFIFNKQLFELFLINHHNIYMTSDQKFFIDSINQKTGNKTSSFSSTSIFIWEDEWKLSVLEGENSYTVFRNDCIESYYFFPQGEESEVISFIKNHLSDENLVFKYLSEKDVLLLEKYFPDQFEIQRDLNSDEYLYSVKDHIALEGKAFANCRNKLRNFSKEHTLRIEEIDPGNFDQAVLVLKDWAKAHENLHLTSYNKLLSNAKYLNADMYLIYMDEKPFSVQCGYSLGNGVFDLCIAQENQNIPGGGYAAKNLLIKTLKDKYDFVNMEEDLGLSGLRIAKSQMAPSSKIEKWLAMKK